MANIEIDQDEDQPRYVPEDVYYAPTEDEWYAAMGCQHLSLRDGSCEDCGLVFWRVWF